MANRVDSNDSDCLKFVSLCLEREERMTDEEGWNKEDEEQ